MSEDISAYEWWLITHIQSMSFRTIVRNYTGDTVEENHQMILISLSVVCGLLSVSCKRIGCETNEFLLQLPVCHTLGCGHPPYWA